LKLYKYFFEPNDFNIEENRQGNTTRSRKGKVFTDYTSPAYRTFDVTIDNVSEQEHYNLLFIISLIFPDNGEGQNVSFTSPLGDNYNVTIPINGYNYTPKNTEEDLWIWELTLEEVI